MMWSWERKRKLGQLWRKNMTQNNKVRITLPLCHAMELIQRHRRTSQCQSNDLKLGLRAAQDFLRRTGRAARPAMLTKLPQLGSPLLGSFQDFIYCNHFFSFSCFFITFKSGVIYKPLKVKKIILFTKTLSKLFWSINHGYWVIIKVALIPSEVAFLGVFNRIPEI